VINLNGIGQTWLQVTVKADANTGLNQDDVFYFGNAIGETGDSATSAAVNIVDFGAARDNPHNAFNRAPIDNPYDFDRDQFVNVVELGLVRDNGTNAFNDLNLITVPVGAGLVAAASGNTTAGSLGTGKSLPVLITRDGDGFVAALTSGPSAPWLDTVYARLRQSAEPSLAAAASVARTSVATAADGVTPAALGATTATNRRTQTAAVWDAALRDLEQARDFGWESWLAADTANLGGRRPTVGLRGAARR